MRSYYKVALVHDWLNGMRGGEKVLEILCGIFPQAEIYTLIYEPERLSDTIRTHRVYTSFLQGSGFIRSNYRYFLPVFPSAIERFNLSGYDLVISTSHCVAKGIRVNGSTPHICYCFTPMRYIWEFTDIYFGWKRHFLGPLIWYLRRWDVKSSSRVDHFITISRFVRERIRRYYRRDSYVLYPPVDLDFFLPGEYIDDYYLIVSALVPYKRIDLAIYAFNELQRPLKIVGTGPYYRKLKRLAKDNIEFLGYQTEGALRGLYQHCKALVFPGVEDFGLVPVEVQACGRPVIGYRGGGLLETVNEQVPTGIFFSEQNPDAIKDAVLRFEKQIERFQQDKIRTAVLRFNKENFIQGLQDLIYKLTGIKI